MVLVYEAKSTPHTFLEQSSSCKNIAISKTILNFLLLFLKKKCSQSYNRKFFCVGVAHIICFLFIE